MKKKIAPLGFLLCTTLLAAGCSKGDVKVVTEDGNYVIYSITVNGKKESFTADDLLAEMADSTVATTRIYNEIARKVFAIAADKTLTRSEITEIEGIADDQVTDFRDNVQADRPAGPQVPPAQPAFRRAAAARRHRARPDKRPGGHAGRAGVANPPDVPR